MSGKGLFAAGALLLGLPTALHAYLLMPFPGSQELDSLRLAYGLSKVLVPCQILGACLGLWGLLRLAGDRPWKRKRWLGVGGVLALLTGIFYVAWTSSAPKLFQPAEVIQFAKGLSDELPAETLVLGVAANGQAKAYPMRLLAYHHWVEDQIAGEPVLATYCTMCRSGRILRPFAEERRLHFQVIGAIHYNSVYEDTATGTWWYQANGKAVIGPLAGTELSELRADQMTLGEWLELHPDSDVMQPDPASADGYRLFDFDRFDEARSREELPAGWQWVAWVEHEGVSRAYPWSVLSAERWIEDEVAGLPIGLWLRGDLLSHRVWERRLGGKLLDLRFDAEADALVDESSGTVFGFDGLGRGGELDGEHLRQVSSKSEFRHAFEQFAGGEVADKLPPQ